MHGIRSTYQEILRQNRLAQFVILISFFLTFVTVRIITYLQKAGLLPNQMGPLHIHHMVPGIILVLVTGYIGLSFWEDVRTRITTALLFGIGAALTIDEFALWLFLKDVYWEKEGRLSVDAAIITIAILLFLFLLNDVHRKRKQRHLKHH